jgi:hypothetical protein
MPGCAMSLRIEVVAALLHHTRRVVLSMTAVLLSGSLQLINNSNPTKMLVVEPTRASHDLCCILCSAKIRMCVAYHYRKLVSTTIGLFIEGMKK